MEPEHCICYLNNLSFRRCTLPETNIAPETRPSQKERIVFQPSMFRCYVSFEGSMYPLFSPLKETKNTQGFPELAKT